MELRRYARIVRRRWLIASIAFFTTLIATLFVVMPSAWIYESSGAMRVGVRQDLNQDNTIRAWEIVTNLALPSTYATIAESDLIKSRVEVSLPPGTDASEAEVDAEVVIDSNFITLTVTDGDPDTAQAVAQATLEETIAYIDEIDDTFELIIVDDASGSQSPVGPNKNLQILVGLVLGALLAVGLALLAEYLRRPEEETVFDDVETGARNELYLRERLREEMARSGRTGAPLAVASLRIAIRTGENDDLSHPPVARDLRRITRGLKVTVPGDAVLAYVGDGTYVAMVPDMDRAQADNLLDGWQAAVRALVDLYIADGRGASLVLSGGTCEIIGGRFRGSSELAAMLRRLNPPPGDEDGIETAEVPGVAVAQSDPVAPAEPVEAEAAPAMPPAPAGTDFAPPAPTRAPTAVIVELEAAAEAEAKAEAEAPAAKAEAAAEPAAEEETLVIPEATEDREPTPANGNGNANTRSGAARRRRARTKAPVAASPAGSSVEGSSDADDGAD